MELLSNSQKVAYLQLELAVSERFVKATHSLESDRPCLQML